MNLLDAVLSGDWYMGICDECHQAKPFATERERDLWEQFHAHDDGDGA